MKQALKYICAAAVTLFIVVLCAWLPPYLARKGDAAFLNAVQKDETAAESYEYKATKYQKTKVLYEAIRLNFEGNNTGLLWTGVETEDGSEDARASESVSVVYTEQPAADSVMTKAQAEQAIVREARQLQEAGAIPKFDLGELGSYDAVEGIAFLRAYDPAVSTTEFYYWEGKLTNPNTETSYRFVIDDEIGKVYFMAIEYQSLHTGYVDGADESYMHDAVAAFAQYHELELNYDREYAEMDYFVDGLYAMTESDFDVLAELMWADVSRIGSFRMILKPSDIL